MSEKPHQALVDDRPQPATGAPAARFAAVLVPLLPAVIVAALMAGAIGGRPGAYLAFAVALLAPGWLVWRILPEGVLEWNEPLGLPALWLVLSFTVLGPIVAGLVYFGWSASLVEWYLLAALVILGAGGARWGHRKVGPWDPATIGAAAALAAGFAYRTTIWRIGTDDHTYIGYLRAFLATGTYPTTNPFMSGDVPLAPRWRLDSWTGLTGVLAHLGSIDVEVFFREVLPGLMVVAAGSALYVLARLLSGSRGFAQLAAVSALVVPVIIDSAPFRSIAYNKFTGLFVFVPVAAALMIRVLRGGRRGNVLVAAAVFWGAMFVHPVPAVFAAALVAGFVAVRAVVNRDVEWSSVGWVGAAMVPMLLTAFIVSSTGERYGVRLGDVESLSEIAKPAFDIGPISIWEPRDEVNIINWGPESAAAVFVRGHANGPAGPRLLFLENGMPFAHWGLLSTPAVLLVAVALLIITYGRHRDDVALWIGGATLVALSVYFVPPLAAVLARFITPWQLWRFVWLMPTALATAWLIGWWLPRTRWKILGGIAVLAAVVVTVGLSSPRLKFPTEPTRSYERLHAEIDAVRPYHGIYLAEGPLGSEAASQLETFHAVTPGGFTHLSNAFPSERRPEAFDRLRDRKLFFSPRGTTAERAATLEQYAVDYVVIKRSKRDRFDLDALGLERVAGIGDDLILYATTASRPG